MEWQDEKEALLARIRRQEQEAATLAKRFKLLQQTLKEQQKLLDRYQHALSAAQTPAPKTQQTAQLLTKQETIRKPMQNLQLLPKLRSPQLRRGSIPVKEVQENKEEKKTIFKSTEKRKSGGWRLRGRGEATNAQEAQVGANVGANCLGANKENVRTGQTTDKREGFAYVEVVRNREERKALPGHDCMECKKYYDALGGLGAADAAAHKNKCSRHRARFEPYQTPDDFWRLSFPDSEPEPRSPSVI
ncbi:Com1/Ctip family [Phytophthora cactorum]|nr:Com1/Ctip family [Phytophthora cactorum]